MKSETRNLRSERRPKPEIRSPKSEIILTRSTDLRILPFGFLSDFGFRISGLFLLAAISIMPSHAAPITNSLDHFVFEHPMTVINRVERAIVKQRIADKTEPQYSAFEKLIHDADEVQSFVPDPPDTMDIMGGYEPNTNQDTLIRPWLWRNSHAAYCSALAYAYTGKTNYAEKAVQILNAWAAKKTVFTGRDRGLQLGSWFSPMLYAADLVHDYPGWKRADREQFNSWWRSNVLIHVRPVMLERGNNWKDAGLLGG